MQTIKQLKSRLDELKGQRTILSNQLSKLKQERKENVRETRRYEQAKEIIREVGQKTQEQLQYHISDITSLALEAVFDEPYKLEVEFVQRRNKTECDIYFSRNGNRVNPLQASGGGAVDIASFALRIASWSLNRPHTRNTIILDEPMRFVSENLRDRVSSMLLEISRKLNLQFIIITHDNTIARYSDKIFDVTIRKGISNVKVQEGNNSY